MVCHSFLHAKQVKEEFGSKETFEMLVPGQATGCFVLTKHVQAPEERLHNVASYPCRCEDLPQ